MGLILVQLDSTIISSCDLFFLAKISLQTYKMSLKVVLLLALIAGVCARRHGRRHVNHKVDSISDNKIEEHENYDLQARNLDDDIHMLDQGGLDDVIEFCSDPSHAFDPVCQIEITR